MSPNFIDRVLCLYLAFVCFAWGIGPYSPSARCSERQEARKASRRVSRPTRASSPALTAWSVPEGSSKRWRIPTTSASRQRATGVCDCREAE